MYLPQISQTQDRVALINVFRGLNRQTVAGDGEWSDMFNITNDDFPVIGTRKGRGIVRTLTAPQGMLGGQYLSYVDDDELYFDEADVGALSSLGVERQLVMMGNYLCVFPDNIVYDIKNDSMTSMTNATTTTTTVTFTLCKLDGTAYDGNNTVASNTAPLDTTKYWIDTSANPVVMKMYNTNISAWVSVGTTYVKVSATGIGEGFKAYDAAKFSGVDENIPQIYNGINFNQTNIIYAADDDWLIIAGLINLSFTNSDDITVEREVPDMDFVCELNNRLWGCNSEKNEIYACKLGDPTNWYCYAGLDSDSYAATAGSQGDFTGCISYSGSVFFFKEYGYHKLYGTKPSNFEMSWKPGRGVQVGSSKSLCIVNDYMYFKSRDAICVYDGSTESVSELLGDEPLYEGVGAGYRTKYYISLSDNSGQYRLYVYDTMRGIWTSEDDTRFIYMADASNAMYMLSADNNLYVVNKEKMYTKLYPANDRYPDDGLFPGNSTEAQMEGTYRWYLITGNIGLESPFQKYLKRLDIRLWLDTETHFRIEINYDSSDQWLNVMEYHCTRMRSFNVPIPVQRCDHLRLRISGEGPMKIFNIAKVMEEGGDLHV